MKSKFYYLFVDSNRLSALLLLITLFFLGSPVASAQQTRISGQVVEAGTSEPLPGVSVTLKGSAKGTLTDVNGRYSIQAGSAQDVLRFTYIGFETLEVPAREISAVVQLKQSTTP